MQTLSKLSHTSQAKKKKFAPFPPKKFEQVYGLDDDEYDEDDEQETIYGACLPGYHALSYRALKFTPKEQETIYAGACLLEVIRAERDRAGQGRAVLWASHASCMGRIHLPKKIDRVSPISRVVLQAR